ncbi:hypothetical protein Bpfe_024506 [Biomphalaria pfeifferi]|uniref:Uncharacterized protein n=1 Tax=Biomphalaria pfeifferi TaxID=112525 RepID=A0AAD8B0Z3_BIOPF|nr:hypothetical protein Bpfe_024506 [Biomphalaria pfeifferi]
MANKSSVSRKNSYVWLIGYPKEAILNARLPSGRDAMRTFFFYHKSSKMTVGESARLTFEAVQSFWLKSRLPIRKQQHCIEKIKDLYNEHRQLVKNRKRNSDSDGLKQKQFSIKLDQLLDISHSSAAQMINNEEDRQFLKLQQQSRAGCIGTVDKKLAAKEKRSLERRKRYNEWAISVKKQTTKEDGFCLATSSNNDDDTDVEDLDDDNEFIIKQSSRAGKKQCKRRRVISSKVSAVLDRTNTSTRAATMILASAFNEAGSSTSTVVLSKSTVHRQRQQRRKVAALEIKTTYVPSISVVHWDGKLIPDLCHTTTSISDRLAILLSSLNDGNVKLLGVPKLQSGSGQAAANAVVDNLKSWSCESQIIGMCFDTTAANTSKVKGACKLLEVALGRNLLWVACRHHMFEVLLADVFTACLGPSTGPEIAIFKLLRDNWSKIHHESKHIFPLIVVSDTVKAFISKELQQKQLREDYRELIALAARAVGLDVSEPIRKPGAIHRARWMAKAIYSLKMQLLLDGNENVLQLTDQQLQGIQRFNHFVLKVYIQSWFTCCSAVDAAVNDISLINRLHDYEEVHLCKIGLMMIKRHSWYLSNEMATLCLFSDLVSLENKAALVTAMISERGPHLLTTLPDSITDLQISREFFTTTRINCSFLDIPVKDWPHNNDYNDALRLTKNLKCVNDSAERGVALIQKFSAAAVDEEQKQFLLQVVEKQRQDFASCNREDLEQI